MKRILGAFCVWGMVSMFFTGCNSVVTSFEVDPRQVGSSVAATETAGEEDVRLNYGEDSLNKEMPDYFEESLENKFKDLTGKQAFMIKEGHSEEIVDIESFEIEELLEDGTFLYSYVTRVENGSLPRPVVHCAASYNYRTGSFQVLHENAYRRNWEDEGERVMEGMETGEDAESFYMQMSRGVQGNDWRLFLYDNGIGYIYDSQGKLMYKTDIETFIHGCFPNVFSVNTYHALTDGNNRIYMELMVQKEEITIPENADADRVLQDEEDEEAEAERIEQEMAEKTQQMILVHEFKPVITTIDQENEQFSRQEEAWKNMTAGKEYESEPDSSADWDKVVKQYPDRWGGAYLPGVSNQKVYIWKGEPVFGYQDAQMLISSFRPVQNSYQSFKDLKENQTLENMFIALDNRYNVLSGVTGAIERYDRASMTRTYIEVTYSEEVDEEGNVTRTKIETPKKQTIIRYRKRRAPLQNPYLQSYGTLEHERIHSLYNCIDGKILCSDGQLAYWLQPEGNLQLTHFLQSEEMEIGAIKDGSEVYLLGLGYKGMVIEKDTTWESTSVQMSDRAVIDYSDMGAEYQHKDTVYDNAFMKLNEKRLGESVDVYSNADFLTEDHVLRAELSVNTEMALRLVELGGEDLRFSSETSRGFLFTSSSKGLIYLEPGTKRSVKLDRGSWYRSWKQGSQFISVGFAKYDTSYQGMDVAHARVYEYNLDELYHDVLEAAIKGQEEKLRKEEEEKASQSLEGMTEETPEETVKDMLEEWEENHKEHYTRVELETAVSAGETFNTEVFDATMEEKQSADDASREQRINGILYGTTAATSAGQ